MTLVTAGSARNAQDPVGSATSKDGSPHDVLSVDRIFASDEFRSEPLPPRHWVGDNSIITVQSSSIHQGASDLVLVSPAGEPKILVSAEQLIPSVGEKPLVVEEFQWSRDLDVVLLYTNSVKVWRRNTRGDYWTFRRSTKQLARIGTGAEPSTLMFAKLSPDGTRVGYVHKNNLYVESTDGSQRVALTNDGMEEVINGTFDWVYEEEFGCRDGWRWSPDGQQIAYWQLNTNGVPKFTLVDYTTGSYPILKSFAYPKTGERNSVCRIGVVSESGGATVWLDIPGDTRTDFYLPRMEWNGRPDELAIQRINRLQNTNDVFLANSKTGIAQSIFSETEETWVDIHDDAFDWLENQDSFTWISERDGWRHLNLVSRDGHSIRQVTTGDFDVIRVVRVDEKAGQVWYLASPDNATQQYLYSVSLQGSGEPTRRSPADQLGTHDYDFSPDGKMAVHTYSTINSPPRIDLISVVDHKVLHSIATNERLRSAVASLSLSPVEFIQVDIGAGTRLDGWLMKPSGFDPAKKYPLVLHVYGEPASQSVKDLWGGRHYLWHRMLTQQGYVVACVDNRGTPCPRGREWRRVAYKRVGTLASQDQVAATRELLRTTSWLDANRVGVWGWSGGGSMTLNLMFRYPGDFHTGIAVASVPNMRLYDTIYQERYMGLPQDNEDAYTDGSPITHAHGLQGNLLIVHGSGDDNCHEQGMSKLVNRLIELNKHFLMMSYPNRSHSIDEGENTSRHLYGLMARFLNENLPAGPR